MRDEGTGHKNPKSKIQNREGCRVLVDGPHFGAWNMAVDEMLVERAAVEERCHLRIYGWAEPTVSLGYFQQIAQRESHLPSVGCALVRRTSGGGAIVHDREITYALALPQLRGAGEQRDLYRRAHQAVIDLLARLGVTASLAAPAEPNPPVSSPFLCFQRRTQGDVLINGCKVVGSAQKRCKDAVLQHGSVLLQSSRAAPELAGIEDLSSVRIPPEEWRSLLLAALLAAFDFGSRHEPLVDAELEAAGILVQRKFGRSEWNSRR